MRTPNAVAVAVRTPDGGIVVQKKPYLGWQKRFPFFKWPMLRGVASLFESLVLGIRALVFSANEALAEDEADKQEELSPLALFLTISASLGMAILLFSSCLSGWLIFCGS